MALTKYNYNSFNVTPVASKALGFNSGANGLTTATEGAMVLIKTLTASSSGTLDFVDGSSDVVLDNTYPIYKFVWINVHPSADGGRFTFQANAAGGSGYNETMTTTFFRSAHTEAGTGAALAYQTAVDQVQGTGFSPLSYAMSNANDASHSGYLHLFNPSSTTFVTHFMATTNEMNDSPGSYQNFVAGYFNTTSAIDEIQFKIDGGNIDAGTFKLYGIKDS